MKVIAVDGLTADVEAKGVKRSVSLMMLPELTVAEGQYVLVQLGYAMKIVSEEDALKSWEMVDEILLALDQSDKI